MVDARKDYSPTINVPTMPFLLLVMEKYHEQILHNSPETIRSALLKSAD